MKINWMNIRNRAVNKIKGGIRWILTRLMRRRGKHRTPCTRDGAKCRRIPDGRRVFRRAGTVKKGKTVIQKDQQTHTHTRFGGTDGRYHHGGSFDDTDRQRAGNDRGDHIHRLFKTGGFQEHDDTDDTGIHIHIHIIGR